MTPDELRRYAQMIIRGCIDLRRGDALLQLVSLGPRACRRYNGLFDENAAAHFAFVSGFAKTRTVPIGRRRYGVNRSRTHLDVMVGTDALDAWGVTHTGKRVALVRDGQWQF
jgi:leucyl aminopeptidase (aminopeptidase T)